MEFSPIAEAEYINLYARDITIQRAAEVELREAYDEAVRAHDEVKRKNDELSAVLQRLDQDTETNQMASRLLAELADKHLSPLRDLISPGSVLDEQGIAKIRSAL